jgi:hypothetical protein
MTVPMRGLNVSSLMAIVGVWTLSGVSGVSPDWPIILPAHASAVFANLAHDSIDTPFSMGITDAAGRLAYRVECHNFYYNNDEKIDYSGDFQCALYAAHGDTVVNLLASATKDEQSSDWFNRGRMLASQLAGRCGSYPEYGAIRHFRLRDMRVTFEFDNLEWAPSTGAKPRLNGFMFTLSVNPDTSAHSSQATVVHVRKPPASCDPIS